MITLKDDLFFGKKLFPKAVLLINSLLFPGGLFGKHNLLVATQYLLV